MTTQRIDFLSVNAARFNQLRDQWRNVAAGMPLPKVAHKLVSLIPTYVNREYGYAFPTDEQLAKIIKATPRTVGRGMNALEAAGLIERQTMVKRDKKGEAIGRLRRIYLTLPNQAGERTGVHGQPKVNGQNSVGERTTVVRIHPDRIISDKEIRREEKKLGAYMPAREDVPSLYRNDIAFLETFDNTVLALIDGKPIAAGEMERLVQRAFDQTTDSSDLFMPFHWSHLIDSRISDPTVAEWFRQRTGQLFHRRAT